MYWGKQLQDETRIILVVGFGASYIRYLRCSLLVCRSPRFASADHRRSRQDAFQGVQGPDSRNIQVPPGRHTGKKRP